MAIAARRALRFTRSGASMRFSRTLMCGHRLKCWNTIPISGRTARAARRSAESGLGEAIVVPRMLTRPALGFSSSARQRSRVVLPEPDGPITQTMSFSATGRLTCRSTSLLPKLLETWSAAMIGPVDDTRYSRLGPNQKNWLCLKQQQNNNGLNYITDLQKRQ